MNETSLTLSWDTRDRICELVRALGREQHRLVSVDETVNVLLDAYYAAQTGGTDLGHLSQQTEELC